MRRRGWRVIGFGGVLAAGVAILGEASPTRARQEDSVTVVAGPRYEAGGLKRWLLGSAYRDLWTTPIRVPVLRPDTFAGGLTLLKRGDSRETLSLRFRGADGRQYLFRSVDKEQGQSLPEDLRGTLTSRVLQDMVSAKHPGAALVVARLLRAAGVLHATPRLAVMADDPILGKHREDFAGMLGTIEERPNEHETPNAQVARNPSAPRGDGRGVPGNGANGGAAHQPGTAYPLNDGVTPGGSPFDTFPRIIGEDELDEKLKGSSENRVESRAYLTARLIDLLVGDWDRHADQWRWAQDQRGRTRYWLSIPRDRDNAFSDVSGVVGMIAPGMLPTALTYGERYTGLTSLMRSARSLDERILAELPRTVWDSAARDLRARITDEVIATAVASMPAEWTALDGAALAARLRARRDALPEVARDAYALLAREVHVAGTDDADEADIERRADGTVRVRLSATNRDGAVYFDRVFVPSETREVRVFLGGGSDRAIVRGGGGDIIVRVLGGGGDDVLEDASDPARGSRVAFYDDSGDNHFLVGPDTRVDRERYEPPREQAVGEENAPPPRDWGEKHTLFAPRLDWPKIIGPVIGGGPHWTRYGFRRFPYASRFRIAALYAPVHERFGIEADARFLRAGGGETRLDARATGLSVTRFYGFGNETPNIDSDIVRVWATEYAVTAEWIEEVGRGVSIGVGPILSHLDPTPKAGSPAELTDAIGSHAFTIGGLGGRFTVDRRDTPTYPRRGAWLEVEAAGYPLARGDAPEPDPFATAAARATAYIPLPGGWEPTIALRAGAETVRGDAPLQYSAFLGGSSSLRGYPSYRFAGEAAVYGGSELRARLGRVNLLIAKPDIGTTLLIDVGRVFVGGEHSRKWHAGYGGGLWFVALDGRATAHVVYAHGEKSVVYLGLGLPF